MTDSAPLSGTGLPPGHAALSVPADGPSTAAAGSDFKDLAKSRISPNLR